MVYGVLLLAVIVFGLYGVLLGRGDIAVPDNLSGRGGAIAAGIALLFIAIGIGGVWFIYRTPTPQDALAVSVRQAMARADVALILWHRKMPDNSVGGQTTMDIRAEDDRIVYDIALAPSPGDDFLKIVEGKKDELKQTACTDPEYKKKLAWGLSVQINYSMNSFGAPPFVITPRMCGY